jgi:putative Holliday junction resolvase
VLALDVGKRRIGLAGTDPTGTIALPLSVLRRTSPHADIDALLTLIDGRQVQLLLVGIALREDGSEGPASRDARFLAAKLTQVRPELQLVFTDEAYTTTEAHDLLRQRGMDGRAQRQVVDAIAAQLILEGWMDRTARDVD